MDNWVVWLAGILVTGIGSVWATVKVVLPKMVEAYSERITAQIQEEARQREFERTKELEALRAEIAQREAGAAAEQSETVALWNQLIQLQTQTVQQNQELLNFTMNLAGQGLQELKQQVHSQYSEVARNWIEMVHEMRHLRAQHRLIVEEMQVQASTREELRRIPGMLLDFYGAQERFIEQAEELIEKVLGVDQVEE